MHETFKKHRKYQGPLCLKALSDGRHKLFPLLVITQQQAFALQQRRLIRRQLPATRPGIGRGNQNIHGLSTYFFISAVVPVCLSTHTLGIIAAVACFQLRQLEDHAVKCGIP